MRGGKGHLEVLRAESGVVAGELNGDADGVLVPDLNFEELAADPVDRLADEDAGSVHDRGRDRQSGGELLSDLFEDEGFIERVICALAGIEGHFDKVSVVLFAIVVSAFCGSLEELGRVVRESRQVGFAAFDTADGLVHAAQSLSGAVGNVADNVLVRVGHVKRSVIRVDSGVGTEGSLRRVGKTRLIIELGGVFEYRLLADRQLLRARQRLLFRHHELFFRKLLFGVETDSGEADADKGGRDKDDQRDLRALFHWFFHSSLPSSSAMSASSSALRRS